MWYSTTTTTIATTLLVFVLWPTAGWTTAQCAFKDQKGPGSFLCKEDCIAPFRQNEVLGTEIYHEDSNLCLAALHAGYLRPEGGTVTFRPYQSGALPNVYWGTLRNRIKSTSGSRPGKLYRFIGDRPMPSKKTGGWTMLVHDSYNISGVLHVSCIGSNSTKIVSWSHKPISDVYEKMGVKQLQRNRADNAHAFVCQGEAFDDDSHATLTFRDAWYVSPTPSVTTSVGENLTISLQKFGSELPENVFQRRLPDGWKYTEESFADVPMEFVLSPVTKAQAGIYIMGNGKADKPWSLKTKRNTEMLGAYFQLIVRDCADQRWGPSCNRWCPDCRNGGQCHPLTGNCICPPGFSGLDCSRACPQDFFGPECQQSCIPYFRGQEPSPLEDSTCKGLTVCLPYPYGCSCVAGYKGPHCDEECPRGHYGPGCSFTCGYCVDEKCNAKNGRCLDGCVDEVACDSKNLPVNLPHLTKPPQVDISSPSSAFVSFDFERRERRIGTQPVKGYVVQYMKKDEDVWESVNVTEEEFRKNRRLNVSNLVPGYQYRLRVLVDTEKGIDTGRTHSRILKRFFELPCQEYKHPKMIALETTETTTILQLNSSEWENFKKCNTVMEAWLDKEKIAEGEAPSLELTDLQGDTQYNVTITLSNVNGKSQVQMSFLTLPEAPDQVTGLELEAGRNNITVDFDTSQGNVTDYILEYKAVDTDLCPGGTQQSIRFDDPPYMITGVDAFRTYNVCVSGTFKGARGNATCSTVVTEPGPPTAAPELVDCEANITAVTCRTDLTEICGNLGSKTVMVEMLTRGRSACKTQGWNVSTLMTQGEKWTFTGTVGNLSANVAFGVKVRIFNEAGPGPVVDKSQILKTLPSVPEKPVLGNVITVSSTSLLLLWDDPCPGKDEILSYQVILKDERSTKETTASIHREKECKDSKYQHCYHLDHLDTGLTYEVQIIANNSLGRSPRSDVKNATTTESISTAPGITVERRATGLDVTLLRPEQTNGLLTKCRLQIFNGSKTCEIKPKFMASVLGACNVTDLKRGERYDVSAQCYNTAGWGLRVNMTYTTLPSAPQLEGKVLLLPHSITKTSFGIVLPKVHQEGKGVSTLSVVTVKMGENEKYSGKNFTNIYFELRNLQNGPRVRRTPPSDPDICPEPPLKRIVAHFEKSSIPMEFTVGEGKTSGGYNNCKLITGHRYLVGVVACTSLEGKLSCEEEMLHHEVLVIESSIANGLAIVISVIIVVVLICILIVAFCMMRRRKSYSGTSTFKKEEDNIAVEVNEQVE
ncbi:uncharacterized protein LOC143035328 isoform X2 [Oratosquilla oratoria]|uniref:uncharacterized protein LOC143035328 isoform X2 n=1 Tax=Oratosquilla oratoria TaxID=337810 RepID=UPI003F76CD7C